MFHNHVCKWILYRIGICLAIQSKSYYHIATWVCNVYIDAQIQVLVQTRHTQAHSTTNTQSRVTRLTTTQWKWLSHTANHSFHKSNVNFLLPSLFNTGKWPKKKLRRTCKKQWDHSSPRKAIISPHKLYSLTKHPLVVGCVHIDNVQWTGRHWTQQRSTALLWAELQSLLQPQLTPPWQ